jgi:hypothetical protein
MMCCNSCPFHPILGNQKEKCQTPVCNANQKNCSEGFCAKNIPSRCFQDSYVIRMLYRQDKLAISLAIHSFRTAVLSNDRGLILALFHAAPEELKRKFWSWLKEFEPKSLWLLNPIFKSIGLLPVSSLNDMGSRQEIYLNAIIRNPYSGQRYGNHQKYQIQIN